MRVRRPALLLASSLPPQLLAAAPAAAESIRRRESVGLGVAPHWPLAVIVGVLGVVWYVEGSLRRYRSRCRRR